jgi:DNA-binding NarL/FixJ family response regulator
MATSVLLADDHPLVRQALVMLLEEAGFVVVGEAADGIQAVRMTQELKPDVVILDLVMPLRNGVEAAREVRSTSGSTKTVLLTARMDEGSLLAALQAGVKGLVLKSHGAEELVQAVREISHGGTYLSPGVTSVVIGAYQAKRTGAPDPLSSRERQVLQLIAEGRGTRDIAALLGVSVKTAESHRGRIMKKLQIRQTAGLVRYAIRSGLSEL